MKPETTSASLLSRVRDGADTTAWREFEARYGDLIVRYCCRLGLQHPDAEDIRQVVMLKLSKALRAFHYQPQRGRFRTYLGRVVRNEVARLFRRPKEARERVDLDDEAVSGASSCNSTDQGWDREWVLYHLRMAMRSIRQTYDPRSVQVFGRLLAGESVDRVAASLDMTKQAVHKIKQRIRDRLRQIVAAQIRDEDYPDG